MTTEQTEEKKFEDIPGGVYVCSLKVKDIMVNKWGKRPDGSSYKTDELEPGFRLVFKVKDRNITEWIVQKLHNNEKVMRIRNGAEVEVPAIKMHEGIAIRGKADIIQGDTIYDLKTTISDLENFAKWEVDKKNYDLQAYIYTRLFDLKNFTFIVINKTTRDIGLITVPDEVLTRGGVKFNLAIEAYKDIFSNGLEEAEYKLDQYIYEAEAR